MLRFNLVPRLQSLGASILCLSFLASCSLPQPQDSKDSGNSATFFIEKASVASISQQLDPKISIPVSKSFNFTACLKDNQFSKAVIRHEFSIQGGSAPQAATSDANGCIVWNEQITYNHLAPAKFIEVQRSLETHGFQKGQRKISYAINPWEDKGYSLLDTKLTDYVKLSESADSFTGKNAVLAPLSMEDMILTVTEDSISEKGVNLSISLSGPVSLAILKTAGHLVYEPLTFGQFEAEISLISSLSENKKTRIRALSAPVRVRGQIAANVLSLKTNIILGPLTKYGQVQLGLRLKAVETTLPISQYEAVYPIAEYDQIKGKFVLHAQNSSISSKPEADKANTFHLDNYLQGNLSGAGDDQAQKPDGPNSQSVQMARVIVSPLKFSSIGFQNTTALKRRKVFSITACMNGPIDKKVLASQTFSVTKLDLKMENITSNEYGCIIFDDSFSFDFLGKECWMDGQIRIQNKNLSMDQILKLKLNPWDSGESSVRDIRGMTEQKLSCAEGDSHLLLSNYNFDKRNNNQYSIDSFMNLKIQKEVILRLQPRLKRPSLTDPTGFEEVPLPNGKYLLRWALTSSQVQTFQKPEADFYQVQSKIVEVHGAGTISESVVFETPDLKSIGNTGQILIEIMPVETNGLSQLPIRTFRGPLILANSTEGANLEVLQESKKSLIESLALIQQTRDNQKALLLKDLAKKETIAEEVSIDE